MRGCRSASARIEQVPERGECAGVGARGATAAQESEREARRRRECRSAGRDGGASVRARGAGASDRVQAPVQVSECKRQNRASDRAWQVRGCRSASARKEQAPEHGKCEVSECQRRIKASARARGATAARVTERGARRRRECQSAGRDGRACVRARGATAVRKYSKCQPHANGRGSRARSKSKSKPSVARPSRGRRLKALVEAIATAVSPRPCGRRSARGRRATGGGGAKIF